MYVEFCWKLVWMIYQLHSQYSKLLGLMLSHAPSNSTMKHIRRNPVTIDNTNICDPGGQAPQLGFRRGEFIAHRSASSLSVS